jgi:hypothetical protein
MNEREEIDVEASIDAYFQQLERERKWRLEQNELLIDSFRSYCEKRGISAARIKFDYVRTIGIVAKYPNLLMSLRKDFGRDVIPPFLIAAASRH